MNLERVSTTKLIDELASVALPMPRLINQNMLLLFYPETLWSFHGQRDGNKRLHRTASRRLETAMASQYSPLAVLIGSRRKFRVWIYNKGSSKLGGRLFVEFKNWCQVHHLCKASKYLKNRTSMTTFSHLSFHWHIICLGRTWESTCWWSNISVDYWDAYVYLQCIVVCWMSAQVYNLHKWSDSYSCLPWIIDTTAAHAATSHGY